MTDIKLTKEERAAKNRALLKENNRKRSEAYQPTLRQRRAVQILAANGGSVGAAMRAAGYSRAMAKSPSKLTKSKGFEELCREVGLTDDFILGALVHDIAHKPLHRVEELKLGADIRGLRKAKLEVQIESVDVPDDVFKRILKRANEQFGQ